MARAVSVVIPTLNRLPMLKRCLQSLRDHAPDCTELIVVDGGSTDGTRDFLAEQKGVHTILEDGPQGMVRAVNKGFRAADREYTMWLNDDTVVMPYAIGNAVNFIGLPAHADVGLVAFYHDTPVRRNVHAEITVEDIVYRILNIRGVPYANFGLGPTDVFSRVGYADERYHTYGWDPDLSLKVWDAGMRVAGCPGALIRHFETQDETRAAGSKAFKADNDKLFRKWGL